MLRGLICLRRLLYIISIWVFCFRGLCFFNDQFWMDEWAIIAKRMCDMNSHLSRPELIRSLLFTFRSLQTNHASICRTVRPIDPQFLQIIFSFYLWFYEAFIIILLWLKNWWIVLFMLLKSTLPSLQSQLFYYQKGKKKLN